MTIAFNQVPSNLLVPLFYVETDASAAGEDATAQRYLIVAQRLATGSVTSDAVYPCGSAGEAAGLFGDGSSAHQMVDALLANDPAADISVAAFADAGAGTQATGTFTIGGSPTATGTIYFYVGGRRYAVGCSLTSTPTTLGDDLVAQMTADGLCPGTGVNVAGVVTVTAHHKGTVGNFPLAVNYYGRAGNEFLPAGVTCVVVTMAGGATDPSITTLDTLLASDPYDYWICCLNDATTLTEIKTELASRWRPERQLYGHCFVGDRGDYATLLALNLNSEYVTCFGFRGIPDAEYVWAAAFAGQVCASLRNDPARPVHSLVVNGVHAPIPSDEFTFNEANALLTDGVCVYAKSGNSVVTSAGITSFKTDSFGSASTAWQQVTTQETIKRVNRRLRIVALQVAGRHKIVDDSVAIPPGAAAVNCKTIKGALVSDYLYMQNELLWVENVKAFAANTVVQRNGANRADVLYAPDLANPLGVIAVRNAFRLQYPPSAA